MYLTAIIEVYFRYILGWGLANTLAAEASFGLIRQAMAEHGAPESEQGSHFTFAAYVTYVRVKGIAISMDGKGRALDNIYIERFWRTIKYQHFFLNPADDGGQLYQGIAEWLHCYHRRDHQGTGRVKPIHRYQKAS